MKMIIANVYFFQVIDRRVRELSINTDVLPLNTPVTEILEKGYKYVTFTNTYKLTHILRVKYHPND